MAKKAVASRMDDLFNDMMLVDSGDLIAGVDEAGRGPLAGAVYAAAVMLNRSKASETANSSQPSAAMNWLKKSKPRPSAGVWRMPRSKKSRK